MHQQDIRPAELRRCLKTATENNAPPKINRRGQKQQQMAQDAFGCQMNRDRQPVPERGLHHHDDTNRQEIGHGYQVEVARPDDDDLPEFVIPDGRKRPRR